MIKWHICQLAYNLQVIDKYTNIKKENNHMSLFSKSKSKNQGQVSNDQVAIKYSDNMSLEESLIYCLDSLNCKFETRKGEADDVFYDFKYQGRFFTIRLFLKKNMLTFIYAYMYSTSADNLNVVRHICNVFNNACYCHKLLYSMISDRFEVAAHCEMPVMKNSLEVEEFASILDTFFNVQRDFSQKAEEEIKDDRGGYFKDFEYHQALDERENTIAHEFELNHQNEGELVRSNEDFTYTISDFMQLACDDITPASYTKLRIIEDDAITTYEDDLMIREMPLYSPIIEVVEPICDGEERQVRFSRQSAVMIVDFQDASQESHSLTINLVARDEDKSTLYYRAYAAVQPADIDRSQSLSTLNENASRGLVSLLLAYDKVDSTKKVKEFDYMWKEYQDHVKDKDASLTTDEMIIAQLSNAHVGLNYYWGRRYFALGQYAQALKLFMNAYHVIKHDSVSSVSDALDSLSFYIGFCLCEMGKFDRAFYYLEICRGSGNIEHVQELVNVLANAGDMRVFHFIDGYLKIVEQNYYNDESELPEHIARFASFLKRRRAYSLINFGKLEDAEKEFRELLEDPFSKDYAINELAYIQKMQRMRIGEDATPDATEHSEQ